MKFFAALAIAASLAVASAQTATAPACDAALIPLATTSEEAKACKTSTGFTATAALAAFPAADAVAKICQDTSCQALLQKVAAAVPTECSLGPVMVKSALVDKFTAACSGAAAGAATGSGSSAGAAEITTPAPTTKATEASAATDVEDVAAGSGSSADNASTPQASNAVPTPAPTSGASTVAAATGAVVMAVAATML